MAKSKRPPKTVGSVYNFLGYKDGEPQFGEKPVGALPPGQGLPPKKKRPPTATEGALTRPFLGQKPTGALPPAQGLPPKAPPKKRPPNAVADALNRPFLPGGGAFHGDDTAFPNDPANPATAPYPLPPPGSPALPGTTTGTFPGAPSLITGVPSSVSGTLDTRFTRQPGAAPPGTFQPPPPPPGTPPHDPPLGNQPPPPTTPTIPGYKAPDYSAYEALIRKLYGNINGNVAAELAPLLAGNAYDRNKSNLQYSSDVATQKAAGDALASLLKDAGTGTQGIYDTAAKELQGLAGGFTGDAASAGHAAAAHLEQWLAANGHDAAGAKGLAAANNPGAALHDSLYQLGGYNPGQNLIEQGAAAGAAATKLPDYARLDAASQIGNLTGKHNTDLADLAAKRDQILAQGPGIANQYRTGALDAQTKLAALKQTDAYNRVNSGVAIQNSTTAQTNATTSAWRAANPNLQFRTVNGHLVAGDPATGVAYIPGTHIPVTPDYLRKPTKVAPSKLAAGKAFVDAAVKGYYASTNNQNTPLSDRALRSFAKQAGEDYPTFLSDIEKQKKMGIGYYRHDQHEDEAIQQMYISLIQEKQIPARAAFNLIKQRYPAWASSHADYFPQTKV